jgi:hypothetical protein
MLAGWFASDSAGRKKLARWTKSGRVKLLGAVHIVNENGRPENVYGVRYVKNLRHDAYLTEVVIRYPNAGIVREPGDPPYPDAIMRMESDYYIELDTGEESLSVIKRKLQEYGDIEGWMLFITLTERRMRSVQPLLPECGLCSCLSRVTADPHGKIWEDALGEAYMLR